MSKSKKTNESKTTLGSLSYDSNTGNISVDGKIIGNWNDDANYNYPEDLTWSRTLGGLCRKMFDAGRTYQEEFNNPEKYSNLSVGFLSLVLPEALRNLECLPTFEVIINQSLVAFNLNELELSEMLKTSRPTILRWKSGETVPHKLIRESIYKTFLKKISDLKSKKNPK